MQCAFSPSKNDFALVWLCCGCCCFHRTTDSNSIHHFAFFVLLLFPVCTFMFMKCPKTPTNLISNINPAQSCNYIVSLRCDTKHCFAFLCTPSSDFILFEQNRVFSLFENWRETKMNTTFSLIGKRIKTQITAKRVQNDNLHVF